MFKKYLFVLLLVACNSVHSQESKVCKELFSQEFRVLDVNTKKDEVLSNLLVLLECGELDYDDFYVFNRTPIFSSFLVNLTAETKKTTYQKLYDELLKVSKTDYYEQIKEKMMTVREIESKKVDIENWEKDKLLFEKIGMPSKMIAQIFEIVKKNTDNNITYKELSKKVKKLNKVKSKNTIDYHDEEHKKQLKELRKRFKKVEKFDFEELKKEANRFGKPLLLFFTGYACVNAVKMENYVLLDDKVFEKLEDFYCVSLYVDDVTELPKENWVKSKRKDTYLKRLGNVLSHFQTTEFKNGTQPFFVIIKENKKYKTFGYGNAESFLKFLK